jgi:Xaa-Pro aminopeptidase
MSGERSVQAYAAYQRSSARRLCAGDLVLVHCNSYLDGYFTNVTRTFCMGEPDDRQRRMYEAVLAGRKAALAAIRPGVRASEVDAAARSELAQRGFEQEFLHATGHGVGLAALDHNARPRIHPQSKDVLEAGMTFNIEPAIYVKGYAGLRHCDMVTVTRDGVKELTPWLGGIEELSIR